jgi:hypothetical protein
LIIGLAGHKSTLHILYALFIPPVVMSMLSESLQGILFYGENATVSLQIKIKQNFFCLLFFPSSSSSLNVRAFNQLQLRGGGN